MTITLPDDPALPHLDDAPVRLELACGLFASGAPLALSASPAARRDVLVPETARSSEELVAQDRNVRLGQSGGGEDGDHLAFGGDGFGDELADGGTRKSANAEVRIPKFSRFDIPNSSFDISQCR